MFFDDIEDDCRDDIPLLTKLMREASSKTYTKEQTLAKRIAERKREIVELMTGARRVYLIPNLQDMVLGGLTMGQGVDGEPAQGKRKSDLQKRVDAPAPAEVDRLDALWSALTDRTYDERGPDTPLDAKGRTALFYVLDPDRVFGRLENHHAANARCATTLQTVLECGVDPTIQDIYGNTALDGADEDAVRCVMAYTMDYRPDVMKRPGVAEWFAALLDHPSKYQENENV